MRKHRSLVLGASVLALALVVAACNSGGDEPSAGAGGTGAPPTDKGEITVGVSGAFAENQLVAEMYAQVLEKAGYTVTRELEIADRAVGNEALEAGEIDLKPEYTGFDLPQYDEQAPVNGDPADVAAALDAAVADAGLETYAFSPANSTNVFVMLPDRAQELAVTDLNSLAPVAGDLTLGGPADCPRSNFCIPGLKPYRITFQYIFLQLAIYFP